MQTAQNNVKTKDDFSDSHLIPRANEARFFSGPYKNQLERCMSDLRARPGGPACRQALESITTAAFRTQYVGDKAKDAELTDQQLRNEGIIAANESSWADLLEGIRMHNLTSEQANIVKAAYKEERKKLAARDSASVLPARLSGPRSIAR